MPKPDLIYKVSRRKLILLVLSLLTLYIIIPQLGRFRSSLTILRHIDVKWLLIAIGLSLITYFMAAASYYLLAKKPIKYFRTVLVQGACMFVNHLVPAGIGNISVNFVYLKENKHNNIEAGSVIAVNNFLGFVGHIILLGAVILITHPSSIHLKLPHILSDFILIGLALALVAGVISLNSSKIRKKIGDSYHEIKANILGYRDHKLHLFLATLCIMSLTTIYSFCLYFCSKALHIDLNFTQCLIVLTIGVAGSTLTPTPGGVIGVEAGLAAALVAVGVAASPALAMVLAYRFVTYWLAIAVGITSFFFAQKNKYI